MKKWTLIRLSGLSASYAMDWSNWSLASRKNNISDKVGFTLYAYEENLLLSDSILIPRIPFYTLNTSLLHDQKYIGFCKSAAISRDILNKTRAYYRIVLTADRYYTSSLQLGCCWVSLQRELFLTRKSYEYLCISQMP